MKATFKRLLSLGLLFAGMAGLVTSVAASGRTTYPPPARPGGVTHTPPASTRQTPAVHEGGVYYSRDQVAQYIRTFGHLPTNFITKAQARALGWTGGPLERYAPGKATVSGITRDVCRVSRTASATSIRSAVHAARSGSSTRRNDRSTTRTTTTRRSANLTERYRHGTVHNQPGGDSRRGGSP